MWTGFLPIFPMNKLYDLCDVIYTTKIQFIEVWWGAKHLLLCVSVILWLNTLPPLSRSSLKEYCRIGYKKKVSRENPLKYLGLKYHIWWKINKTNFPFRVYRPVTVLLKIYILMSCKMCYRQFTLISWPRWPIDLKLVQVYHYMYMRGGLHNVLTLPSNVCYNSVKSLWTLFLNKVCLSCLLQIFSPTLADQWSWRFLWSVWYWFSDDVDF